MMSRFTGATDSSHKIEIESKEINIDMPQDMEPAIQRHSGCCIYKVPNRLRKVNKNAYTPKLISIGPIHRGNPELMDMEIHKHRYCEKFFFRTKKAKEEFESIIEKNEDKIRNCYEEEVTLPCEKEFVNMILLDSIFIIELFWMTANGVEDKNEYILSKPWLEEGIKYDLILLENQLPLFILNELYSQSGDEGCFITLACYYFFPNHKQLSTVMKEVKHFTDLHRTFYRPPRSEIRDRFSNSVPLLYSATELQKTAGLIFQKYKGKQSEEYRGLLDIQLNSSCLTYCLVVPQFVVDDGTEEFFRNLMALEQCHYPDEAYICNYIVLLYYLINSKKDVKLLVDKRIIVNLLDTNKAVAKMVSKLCLEIVETNSYYGHIIDDLNRNCESPWRNTASLISVYFRDIWRGTTTIAGALVLFITIFNFLKPFFFKNI